MIDEKKLIEILTKLRLLFILSKINQKSVSGYHAARECQIDLDTTWRL